MMLSRFMYKYYTVILILYSTIGNDGAGFRLLPRTLAASGATTPAWPRFHQVGNRGALNWSLLTGGFVSFQDGLFKKPVKPSL